MKPEQRSRHLIEQRHEASRWAMPGHSQMDISPDVMGVHELPLWTGDAACVYVPCMAIVVNLLSLLHPPVGVETQSDAIYEPNPRSAS